ncbi:Dabb family protein [Devosia chinhatensis]|uniref:Stress responsive protein n=1 Tax=Devosia chinhatensis TaxID=429727 RepID=A0A0F5FNG4_9HYPH|nr:Dabb family protein [Devosia chinhatensis]KKB10373.1 stress responsive protein [Devosia chinhatensis]
MIRHIVFFTAKSPDKVDAICEGLSLLAAIPYSLTFEVTRNDKVDLYGNEIDVVVYAEFADRAAFDAYKAHPNYDEATRRVRPLRELRYAADIPAESAVMA